MTGEISAAMTRFKEAHARMVANVVAEMDKATASTAEVEAEGIAAVKLPAAMIEQSRTEIREMTAEFATQTNGGPPGPLPGSKALLPDPSANSADGQSAEKKS